MTARATNGAPLGTTGIPRSPKWHALAMLFESWPDELCAAYGFDVRSWYDHNGQRVIELLGPDSPGEYVYRFPLWRLREEHLQALVREIIVWVDDRGYEFTGQRVGGDVMPPVVRETIKRQRRLGRL